MSRNLQYNVATPTTIGPYSQNKLIDFRLNFLGMKLFPNSIRFAGTLKVKDHNGNLVTTNDVFSDAKTGIHNYIRELSVETQNEGVKQVFNNYARGVRMLMDTTKDFRDYFNSEDVSELKSPKDGFMNRVLQGETIYDGGLTSNGSSFYCKPLMIYNMIDETQSEQGGLLNYSQTGEITLSIKLNSITQSIYGQNDNISDFSYEILNPRIYYRTVPDEDGKKNRIFSEKIISDRQTIYSSNANLQFTPPQGVDSISMSFINENHDYNLGYNSLATENWEGFKSVKFLMNGVSQVLDFVIEDRVEALDNYIESMKKSFRTANNNEHTDVGPTKIDRNDTFGLGLYFGQMETNSKFNVELKSTADTVKTYNVYVYFHSWDVTA